jgi:hypothetical protein
VHRHVLRLAMLDAYYAVLNAAPAFTAALAELRDALAPHVVEPGAGLVDDPDGADTPADVASRQLQVFARRWALPRDTGARDARKAVELSLRTGRPPRLSLPVTAYWPGSVGTTLVSERERQPGDDGPSLVSERIAVLWPPYVPLLFISPLTLSRREGLRRIDQEVARIRRDYVAQWDALVAQAKTQQWVTVPPEYDSPQTMRRLALRLVRRAAEGRSYREIVDLAVEETSRADDEATVGGTVRHWATTLDVPLPPGRPGPRPGQRRPLR